MYVQTTEPTGFSFAVKLLKVSTMLYLFMEVGKKSSSRLVETVKRFRIIMFKGKIIILTQPIKIYIMFFHFNRKCK